MLLHSQRRFLLAAPLVVLPFLCAMFYALGGGRGPAKPADAHRSGLNKELPAAYPDPKKAFMDKMGAYRKADQDSFRKRAFAQQDPYRARDAVKLPEMKATELLAQLDRLKQTLQEPQPVRPLTRPTPRAERQIAVEDSPAGDPQLDRLDNMLNKVIRIQHPMDHPPGGDANSASLSDAVLPADSASNAIAAVIPSDQTLTAGGTIPLRLSEDVVVHGVCIKSGAWVYGTANITGDRLLIQVRSVRDGRNLYTTDLQVYDLDGMPGVHIPDVLSQDVAKQSAVESASGLNLLTTEPGLGAEAANAGVQAARSLLTRKARLVRVSVRAGYQVLLKNTNNKLPIRSISAAKPDSGQRLVVRFNGRPPGFVPGGSFIERCQRGGVELKLEGIVIADSLLWFALGWENHSPIAFAPEYYRWVLRDRHSFRRTAQQEMPVEPVCAAGPVTVSSDSSLLQWAGFRPFAPSKDKELVLEVGEKNGGRVLSFVIRPKQILHAKKIDHEKIESGAAADPGGAFALHPTGVPNDDGVVEEDELPNL